MKRLFLSVLSVCLASCSLLQGQRAYDPVEYSIPVNLAVAATHAVHRCDQTQGTEFQGYLQTLNHDSLTLVEYASSKQDNSQVLPAAQQIRSLVVGMTQRPTPSIKYCGHKLSNIQASARMLARSLGGSSKFNACFGDVGSRYYLFESSYAVGLITQAEYHDLLSDLLKLEAVDRQGCDLQIRIELEKTFKIIKAASSLLGGL